MKYASGLAVLVLLVGCEDGASPDAGGAGGAGGSAGAATSGPTFHADVEPVLQQRCQNCHREGGIAPHALTDYESVRQYASRIAQVTRDRSMPPWGAARTEECNPRLPFRDDMSLTDAQIELFQRWSEAGAPEGDPAKAPPAVSFTNQALPGVTDDLTFDHEYNVAAGISDEFVCFVIDPKVTETTYVDGIAVVPGNPLVVHHTLVFKDPKRESLKLADADGKYPCFGGSGVGSASLFAAWAPGVPPSTFSGGAALELEKDSLLIVQQHYHPQQTQDSKDQTRIQLRRLPQKPAFIARTRLLGNASTAGGALRLLPGPSDTDGKVEFRVPAGATDHTETMEFTIPSTYKGVRLASVASHMHWVAKDMKIEVLRAPGSTDPDECLMQTPYYNFNWQRSYDYEAPSFDSLPALNPGDKLRLRCTYDNSMQNPWLVRALQEKHLPSPIDVQLGEETLDEMCLGAFTLISPADADDGPGSGPELPPLPCDVGQIPPDLPAIHGSLAALDSEAGSAPADPTGGDPTGLWYVDSMTTYLPKNLAGLVDLETSAINGQAFFEFGPDGTFRQVAQLVSTLVTGPAGTIEQLTSRSSQGTFTVQGTEVVFSPSCPEGPGSSSRFSVQGDRLTVVSEQQSQQGKLTLVMEAKKQ